MFAPPNNRARALFTIWAQPQEGSIRMWVGNKPFSEFYLVSEGTLNSCVGSDGWRLASKQKAKPSSMGFKLCFSRSGLLSRKKIADCHYNATLLLPLPDHGGGREVAKPAHCPHLDSLLEERERSLDRMVDGDFVAVLRRWL